jgi:hypothetical protein
MISIIDRQLYRDRKSREGGASYPPVLSKLKTISVLYSALLNDLHGLRFCRGQCAIAGRVVVLLHYVRQYLQHFVRLEAAGIRQPGAMAANGVSMRTEPVKVDAGPFTAGLKPLRMMGMVTSPDLYS